MSAARVYDIRAARLACDRGIENARKGAGSTWMKKALVALARVALKKKSITSDDVRRKMHDPGDPRAWGPVMQQAQRLGWIKRTARVVAANRTSCHRRPMRVWRSILWSGR